MTRSSVTLIAIGTGVVIALSDVHARQQPTGSISGIVLVDDAAGGAIPRAVVTLSGAELRPSRLVVADEGGRFTVGGLPAGRFTVSAAKASFVTMSLGQTSPGVGTGVPLSLQPGQTIGDVTIRLPRAAAISGRVVDDGGRPMRGAGIMLMQPRMINGERRLADIGNGFGAARSDGRGMYRIGGLVPGDYVVCAFPPSDGYLGSASTFAPGGGELRQVSGAELQWALQQLSGARGASAAPPPGPAIAVAPGCYPSGDERQATPLSLSRGDERSGIDLTLRIERTANISGRVVGIDGQPVSNARLSFMPTGGSSSVTWTSPDGTFSRQTLLPGTYTLTARSADSRFSIAADIVVNGEDKTDLSFTLQPSAQMNGRVVFEATTLTPPSDLTTLRIGLMRIGMSGLPPQAAVRADGGFTFLSLDPGRYRVRPAATDSTAPAAAQAWRIKSAMVAGRDVLDVPFEVQPNQNVDEMIVTFTDRATELSGTLLDPSGRPAAGFYVVVFSTDRTYWVQNSRRLPAPVRAASDGQFKFVGLPPGTYHVVAFTDVDPSSLLDAQFLAEFAKSAITVSLAEGEKKVQELRLAR